MGESLLLVGDSQSNQNLYYKTHFLAGDPFVYLEEDGQRLLVVNSMEQGRAEKESIVPEVRTFDSFGYNDLIRASGNRNQAFLEVLRRIVGPGNGGVTVEGLFPVAYADSLRQSGVTLQIATELLRIERRQKSDEEIEAIEVAQRATERATAAAIQLVAGSEERNGMLHYRGIPLTSERLRAEIEISLTRENMDPGTPIVAGGRSAADPHVTGTGAIRAGEAIIFDVFPRSKSSRYYADMTRTVVKGNPGDMLRAMYHATNQALDAALAEVRAGANGKNAHEAVKAVYKDAGFDREDGPRFIHGTGHGVGLDIHEGPGLGIIDVELLPGDVITVEPGLYDPAVGGIRIEDMVVVTKDGYRNLTQFPKQFEV
ncbi:MAG: M24 family metallopeptidase [Chloroflexota bacterium]